MKEKKLGNGEMGKVVALTSHMALGSPHCFRVFKTIPNMMHVLKHNLGEARMNND